MSDPIKLSQVFMNLVGNALKFTKDGEVRVIAKLVKKEEEDDLTIERQRLRDKDERRRAELVKLGSSLGISLN